MRVLHLTLKKKWFDMIMAGVKAQEYREIKPYWTKRLVRKEYDVIEFRNGYGKNVPCVRRRYLGYFKGRGLPDWGAPEKTVYVLPLGKVM